MSSGEQGAELSSPGHAKRKTHGKNPEVLKAAYNRMRQLIVWLGLTELAWVGYWLLANGSEDSRYRVTVIGWIVVMLAWLVLTIYLGARDFFLRSFL